MRFPVTIKHRSQQARIYAPRGKFAYYRVAWKAAGRSLRKTFSSYSMAKEFAEVTVKELAAGNQSVALTNRESADTLVIRGVLDAFRVDTGKTVSALEAVKAYTQAAKLLGKHDLLEAVRGYLRTVVVVKRKDLTEAVREFIAEREPRTIPKRPGERPKLNPIYHRIVERYLIEFAEANPGHTVADLTRAHIAGFFAAPAVIRLAPKSINDRRACLKMFFRWCADVDRCYLAPDHALNGGKAMQTEEDAPEEIECYSAAELRTMLDAATGELRAVIAIQAFAGLRLQEVLRMDWQRHVFASPGHIKVTADIAKTRSRRVVEVCPALEQWLAPYRERTGKLWTQTPSDQGCITAMARFRESLEIPSKKNGLRHGFVSAHLAVHQDAAFTAMQAGNSPSIIDSHYKELMTPAEGRQWFATLPSTPANVIPLGASGVAVNQN